MVVSRTVRGVPVLEMTENATTASAMLVTHTTLQTMRVKVHDFVSSYLFTMNILFQFSPHYCYQYYSPFYKINYDNTASSICVVVLVRVYATKYIAIIL